MTKKGLQMFTSWCHEKSKFQIGDFKTVAEMKDEDFLDQWKLFKRCHSKVQGFLGNSKYFEYLKKWDVSLATTKGIITEMQGILFDIVLMKRFYAFEQSGMKTSQLEGRIKGDALMLLDRLVYERLDGKWKGSGDSAAAAYIDQWKDHTKAITKISDKDWEEMIAKMCWGEGAEAKLGGSFRKDGPEKSTIGQPFCEGIEMGKFSNADKQSFPKPVRSFLIHFYLMTGTETPLTKWGSESAKKYHWDHIIPESLVATWGNENHRNWFGNNLTNCQALPTAKNTTKSDHALGSPKCMQNDLASAIETYSGIKKRKQGDFNDAGKLEDLCIWRGMHIIDSFLTKRGAVM